MCSPRRGSPTGAATRGTRRSVIADWTQIGQAEFYLVWLANPLSLVVLVLLWQRRSWAAAAFGAAATALAVSCVLLPWQPERSFGPGPVAGAYVWAGSCLVLAGGCVTSGLLDWCRGRAEPVALPDRNAG